MENLKDTDKTQGRTGNAFSPDVEESHLRNALTEMRAIPHSHFSLNQLANEINEWGASKGWNEDFAKDNSLGLKIALMHTELSEALEELRSGHSPTQIYFSGEGGGKLQKPEGFPIELADLLIRLLHVTAYFGIDIEQAVRMKMRYNETRPYRHGGKTA